MDNEIKLPKKPFGYYKGSVVNEAVEEGFFYTRIFSIETSHWFTSREYRGLLSACEIADVLGTFVVSLENIKHLCSITKRNEKAMLTEIKCLVGTKVIMQLKNGRYLINPRYVIFGPLRGATSTVEVLVSTYGKEILPFVIDRPTFTELHYGSDYRAKKRQLNKLQYINK